MGLGCRFQAIRCLRVLGPWDGVRLMWSRAAIPNKSGFNKGSGFMAEQLGSSRHLYLLCIRMCFDHFSKLCPFWGPYEKAARSSLGYSNRDHHVENSPYTHTYIYI